MDFSLSKEQTDIKRAAAEFARGEFKPEIIQACELDHRFPTEIYRKAGDLGFIGLDYPETIGGGDMGVLENVFVVEEFCKADSGLGMAMHLAFLPAKMVKLLGNPAQCQKYLRPVSAGDWVSAVSFTEPDHGSDLTRLETTLREEADGFRLNGTKIFITNAAYADFFVVLAQEDPAARPGSSPPTCTPRRSPPAPGPSCGPGVRGCRGRREPRRSSGCRPLAWGRGAPSSPSP